MESQTTPVLVGDEQIIDQAVSRAMAALVEKESDLGIGFAEGVITNEKNIFIAAWCAIVNKKGESFLGQGKQVYLSNNLLAKLRKGSLTEEDIEEYLQATLEKPYDSMLENAMAQLLTQSQ